MGAGVLTDGQLAQYAADGYLVVPDRKSVV